jgi:sugar transferase (PEP-CTERM/EpsH1 system associated)
MPGASEEIVRKVRVVPNGVDMEYFDPAGDRADPYEGNGQVVVFTGAMDYHANVDGVCWFVEDVWPSVREACPGAQFYIVGNNPTASVTALSAHPGIVVTGRVPDVRPWLRHAKVAVAPLRLARGVQNKVLEALAMELFVVARPEALRGLEAPLPSGVMVAESAKDFSGALIQCLKGLNVCSGGAGRTYARRHYGWEANLAHLDEAIALADRIVVDTSTTCPSAGV